MRIANEVKDYIHSIKQKFKLQTIFCKRLSPEARLPKLATVDSAGMDLYAAERCELEPGQRALVKTGIVAELPRGYHLEVRPRSGLALKHGITVLNTPGTVDADYRGELQVLLINLGSERFVVEVGDRIAQALLMQHLPMRWQWGAKLAKTERGEGGWGHSGRSDKR
ncbi:MAG: dUTP diphosphatase [Bradymonadales bacterium]